MQKLFPWFSLVASLLPGIFFAGLALLPKMYAVIAGVEWFSIAVLARHQN